MKNRLSLKSLTYNVLYYSQWPAGIIAALLTVFAGKDPINYEGWPNVQQAIGVSKEYSVLALVLAAYVGVANYTSKKIGTPWAWKAIKHILDRFQKQVIKGVTRPKYDEHRVTLFKFVRWNLRMSDWTNLMKAPTGRPRPKELWNLRWFKPIARSGHVTQRLTTRFPLFETEMTGEGVIGQVWRTQGVQRIKNLPEIPVTDGSSPDVAYATYAKKVNCSENWLRMKSNRTRPRSYCGIPVEVDGNLWGVILIDSVEPDPKITDEQIELAAVALGKFIEKA